ncbi:hypothetical protein MERGE_000789 [Pneumocystis wakefieldiae]|uniref:1-phosphatidylinositol 4-kinase n=1 Tax=Pneumocystis wakefieldiae TaxID=38082 RepID=A0A899FR56_9ASCO|nr:hypothetical protein MERGE_000789 [Pneumocystis wakefieldiae]
MDCIFTDIRRTALRKLLILSFDKDGTEILAKSKQTWEILVKNKLKSQKSTILNAIGYKSQKKDVIQMTPREFHAIITEFIYEIAAILKSSYGSFTLSSFLDVDKVFYLKDLANNTSIISEIHVPFTSLCGFLKGLKTSKFLRSDFEITLILESLKYLLSEDFLLKILNLMMKFESENIDQNNIAFLTKKHSNDLVLGKLGNDIFDWEEILTDSTLNFDHVHLEFSTITSIVQSLKDTIKYLSTFSRSNIVESNTFQKVFSYSLRTTCLCCMIIKDFSLMSKWFEKLLEFSHEGFSTIYTIAIQDVFAAIALCFPDNASVIIQYFRMHILHFSDSVTGLQHNDELTALVSKRLTYVLKHSSQDAIITTIYSLANSISSNIPKAPSTDLLIPLDQRTIAALSISILVQKYGKIDIEVDKIILEKLANVTKTKSEKNVMSIIKFYSRVAEGLYGYGLDTVSDVFQSSLAKISSNMEKKSGLLTFYLNNLLNIIIRFDKVPEKQNENNILNILHPLAILLQKFDTEHTFDSETILLFCNMWFTFVLCGFTKGSALVNQNIESLKIIATYSPPLVLDNVTTHFESDLELNTVLRRGGSQKDLNFLRETLSKALPSCAHEIRSASYSKTVYLSSVFLLETLRSSAGICSYTFAYLKNTNIKESDIATCISAIAHSQPRELALKCCDKVISSMPSVLCSQSVLYTLLESLSLLWYSCANEYLSEYTPQYTFSSTRGHLSLEFSDSYIERKIILRDLLTYAKRWLSLALQISPLDLKSLLHTYLSDFDDSSSTCNISLGKTVALDIGASLSYIDKKMFGDLLTNVSSEFISEYTIRQLNKFPATILHPMRNDSYTIQNDFSDNGFITSVLQNISQIENDLKQKKRLEIKELKDSLQKVATCIITGTEYEKILARYIVRIPFMILNVPSIKLGISLWTWIITERPSLHIQLLTEISRNFQWSIRRREGLFSDSIDPLNAFAKPMEYLPTDRTIYDKEIQRASKLFTPHLLLTNFLSSHLRAFHKDYNVFNIISSFFRFIGVAISNKKSSKHILSRELHLHLFNLGFKILKFKDIDPIIFIKTRKVLYSAIFAWFSRTPKWAFGGNKIQLETELNLLTVIQSSIEADNIIITSTSFYDELFDNSIHEKQQKLLYLLVSHEKYRISTWLNVREIGLSTYNITTFWENISDEEWKTFVNTAWSHDPILAINLVHRFKSKDLHKKLKDLVLENPFDVIDCPCALSILFDNFSDVTAFQLKYLQFWSPVVPLTAITYFLPTYSNDGFILQYAVKILEHYSLDVIFFYVPELVQALRYDTLGYIEQFIVETSILSELFAHQIIWNIKANSYKDENASEPDSIKPVLDRVVERIILCFTEEKKDFYQREFNFFNKVTSISGKLKPYIKKSKLEKKEKIDLEISKIEVDSGVYLPSNPDDIVIGIDRKSGKPLQSHAKAPFIATFRVKKKKPCVNMERNISEENINSELNPEINQESWKSSIFKVGDDCRQDVLALQLISMFRNIFNDIGLSLYVFPYRVTATSPGCGIIDVLPDSISRDMLGREAVNGLYEYFITKFGNENSIEFQRARNNFVQSMAAYSVITYLLQIKDRHNGNIMIDREGHIVHIDFGFLLDIAPGGITFESSPFKLTREMIANYVLKLFLHSGLPCFKGTTTINNLRSRFHLDQEDHEAARTMIKLINNSYENKRTVIYDQFQSITNGIPY